MWVNLVVLVCARHHTLFIDPFGSFGISHWCECKGMRSKQFVLATQSDTAVHRPFRKKIEAFSRAYTIPTSLDAYSASPEMQSLYDIRTQLITCLGSGFHFIRTFFYSSEYIYVFLFFVLPIHFYALLNVFGLFFFFNVSLLV